jgi:ribosomal protein S18 acetylase RimI-like enzyme
LQIRPATVDDARAIAEIHVRTWQAAYPGIVPAEYLASLSVDKHEAMWRESVVTGRPELLVAMEGDEMLGWVAFGPSRDDGAAPDDAEIWAIYVGASHWGRGVGRALWRHLEARLRGDHFKTVCLWAFPENVRATRFYESLGFAADVKSAKQFRLGDALLNEIRYVRRIDVEEAAGGV